jgi:hypothetical protein
MKTRKPKKRRILEADADGYVDDWPRYDAKYHPRWAFKFALNGDTNAEMAAAFGVGERCFEEWMQKHAELKEQVQQGRHFTKAEVSHAVYRAAKGYSHPAVKIMSHMGDVIVEPYIERYPPNMAAAEMFLNNRDPKKWKKKSSTEVSGPDGEGIEVELIRRVIVRPKD